MKLTSVQSRAMRTRLAALFTVCLLSACADVPLPGVYRIDIQQGNVITQEQLAALEAGMEKRKVRFILGTPLVTDVFNQQRWDYYYSLEQRGEDRVQRIVSVFFDGERLSHVTGDVRAADGPIKLPERADTVVAVPEGYRDRGIFETLTPSFLSGKPKLRPSEDRDKEPGEDNASREEGQSTQPEAETSEALASATPVAASAETADSPPTGPNAAEARSDVEINSQDETYLRDLLGGFGNTEQSEASANNEPAANDGEEEGLLSRWAKRLGWGDDESPPASNQDNTTEPPPSSIQ